MRTRLLLFVLIALLPFAALAEPTLELSAPCLAVESILDFTVGGEPAPAYRYTLTRGEEEIFRHETELSFGSYLPREAGEYTLEVAALHEGGEETVRARFTVTPEMTFNLPELPEALTAGEPLLLDFSAQGGTGVYRYLCTLTPESGDALVQAADSRFSCIPVEEGRYTLHVLAQDSLGSRAQAQGSFTVEPGPGISLQPSGGSLCAHGGQKSWIVYAPGCWTASTEADFLTLSCDGGDSGSTLTVTALPTQTRREGAVTLRSGDRRLDFTVVQTADHGVDEELYLQPAEQPVLIGGVPHAAWHDALGSRSFPVSGEAWTAETQSPFITLEHTDAGLTLTVAPSDRSAVRQGLVTLRGEHSAAYIHVYQPPVSTLQDAPAENPVSFSAQPEEQEDFILYSQFSGQWKKAKYGSSTLEHSGCAIFALSHALQLLGFEGEAIAPPALARKYAFCLRDGGTVNSTLVGNAGDDFGFRTRYDLYENLSTIRSMMREGAVYSFSVASGHIAMVAGMSEDGSMFRIVDSAPSATWERIKNAQIYRQTEGGFEPIASLAELEGIRYYPENGVFGGAEYWLTDDYVARRGVRLIRPLE